MVVRIQKEKDGMLPDKVIQGRLRSVHSVRVAQNSLHNTEQVGLLISLFFSFENFVCKHVKCNKTAFIFVYK